MKPRFTLPIFALFLFFAYPAFAAVPDITGTITRTPETVRPPEPMPQRETIPGLEQAPEPVEATGGPTLFVREFRFTGAEFIPEEELKAAIRDFTGRDLTLGEIEEAAARITQYYQHRGFSFTRAYLPRQDARDGILTITVVVGRYGEVSIQNNSLLQDWFARGMFNKLKPGGVARDKDLERAIFLTGDLPGARTPSLAMGPGKDFGTANMNITVPAGKRFGGYLLTDNHGSRYTGVWRMGAGVSVKSPLGIGDELSINGMGTEKTDKGIWNGGIAYSLPLGYSGLRGEFGVDRTTYEELGKEYRVLDATGHTDAIRIGLAYPLIRSIEENLWLRLQGAHKQIQDKMLGMTISKRRAMTGTASARYDRWFDVDGEYRLFTSTNLGLTYGNLYISDSDARAMDKSPGGPRISGDFSYLSLNFMANYAFTDEWSFNLTFNAQQALNKKNLDGSEQFISSGPSGVRAFRESVSGDSGFTLNGELRYKLPTIADTWEHSVGLFSAIGRTEYSNRIGVTGDTITDAGFGYYANSGPFFLRAQVAQILGSKPKNLHTGGETQFLVQFGLTF